ncbi:MAG: hypothetical protein R3Y15_02050 [Rikenellaceae bacterium]
MKNFKLVGILCLALFAFSCEKSDGSDTLNEDLMSFTGEVVVTSSSSAVENFDNAVFTAELDMDAQTVDIVMIEISFATGMPAQTMTLEDVPYTLVNDKAVILVDSIIPEIGGLPYPAYTISDLAASISTDQMLLSFSCISYTVVYSGEI